MAREKAYRSWHNMLPSGPIGIVRRSRTLLRSPSAARRLGCPSAAGVQKLAGAELEERLKQVRLAWAERLFPLTDEAYTLSTIDGIEVSGRPTVGIKASHADGGDSRFYFDKETYLIAKIEAMVISPQHGPDPVLREAFYTGRTSYGPSKFKLIYDKKLFVEGETVDYKVARLWTPSISRSRGRRRANTDPSRSSLLGQRHIWL